MAKNKKKKLRITIKPEDVVVRNEFHFDIQRKYRMQIVQSKKHKKEKHKKDYLLDNYD